MTEIAYMKAKREAKRFLEAANAYEKACFDKEGWSPSKERGSLKRASLDLTRALAEMRKP